MCYLIAVIIFAVLHLVQAIYGKWRLLNESPRKGEGDVKVITLAPVEPEKPDSCFFCGGPPWFWLPINFARNGVIVATKRVMVCADHHTANAVNP